MVFSNVHNRSHVMNLIKDRIHDIATTPNIDRGDTVVQLGSSEGPSEERKLEEQKIEHSFYPENSEENTQFHALFKLEPDDHLLTMYRCAILQSVLTQGWMYLSKRHICFHSRMRHHVVIPYSEITKVVQDSFTSHLTFGTISIHTKEHELIFASLLSRSTTMKAIRYARDHYSAQPPAKDVKTVTLRDSEEVKLAPEDIPKNLHVTMLIIGSRGDVQPFAALALELMKIGHRVRIATHEAHRKFVEDLQIDFYPLAGDPKDLMKLCVDNQVFSPAFMKESVTNFTSFIEKLLLTSWDACKNTNTDLILYNPPSMAGPHIAQKLKIPVMCSFTMPWSRTTLFPHPFAVPPFPMGSGYNYASYVAVETGMYVPLRNKFNHFRREVLSLPPTEADGARSVLYNRDMPFLYCWSPSVLPKPGDWPEYYHVTGYWFLDGASNWKPPAELLAFLEKEPKPIYIGFGSVSVDDPDGLTKMIMEALKESKQRAVLVKGWGGFGDFEVPENVYMIDNVPHDWLFPKMAGVVHHGGAGTVAAGLKAGVPTMIVPFFGDQFFWGDRLVELGVGIPYMTVKSMTIPKLVAAFTELASNKDLQTKAAVFGEQIRQQEGTLRAVEAIHRQVHKFRQTPPPEEKKSRSFSFRARHNSKGD
eukprot:TRINITY_DN1524_c0_g1_i1.p1 TRINITY_DN1524_c0_g1~~TRINITY_DN1524_c0_g1_i1.p1  ORF type:complete len:646 (+),score=199.34 TRINITY_DN1524_c0_g1_i1:1073-3010(+)